MADQSGEHNNTNDIPEFFLKRKKMMEKKSGSSDQMDMSNKNQPEKKIIEKRNTN